MGLWVYGSMGLWVGMRTSSFENTHCARLSRPERKLLSSTSRRSTVLWARTLAARRPHTTKRTSNEPVTNQ
eukprot:6326607-Pyramimonas_sp.AAC.1